MARKEYTEAEKAAYKAGKAAKGGARTRSTTTARTRKRTAKKTKVRKKRSGCIYYESYRDKDGNESGRPKIFGWRSIPGVGKQTFNAFLSKNDGAPKNPKSEASGESCRVFVVNLVTEGIGEQTLTGVYSLKYRKLSITSLSLVANPHSKDGGYFGRGGSRYKSRVK